MIENKTIEAFLSAVHEALGPMSIAEKSDIIVELHTLILRKNQQESKPLPLIIKELGSPVDVAQRLTLNRYFYNDLSDKKPLQVSVLRWITLSIVIVFILLFLILGALVGGYTSIAKQTKEGISLFGGIITLRSFPQKFECSLPTYPEKK